jgi:uncharacterized protein with GYD domain
MTGKYSAEGLKQVSSKRNAKASQIVQKCGGSITSVYATLGETDLLVIAEFPGVDEAMKASVELNKALGISFSTTPAMRIEDFDKLITARS